MRLASISIMSTLLLATACSSGPKPQTETLAYAKLNHERVYEYDFPATWKAIEETFRNYQVTGRDPDKIDSVELRKMHKRKLDTDWIYAQSRDKVAKMVIDNIPRTQPLQTRIKYHVAAETIFGGTKVTVTTTEEIEAVNDDGSHKGYTSSDTPDPSRAAEILDKIGRNILAAPPTETPGQLNS